jgi:DNA-binding NarL/FixJ family response regulator
MNNDELLIYNECYNNAKPSALYFCTTWPGHLSKAEFNTIEIQMNGRGYICDSWHGLTSTIYDVQPDLMIIHIDTILEHSQTDEISNVINVLRVICDSTVVEHTVRFGVVINKYTTIEYIKKLQLIKDILGIIPSVRDFGMTTALEAIKLIFNGNYHWPAAIIDSLPHAAPISVYFRSDWKTYITDGMKSRLIDNCPWQVQFCENWGELSGSISKNPHQIIFHIDMIKTMGVSIHEFVSMIETLVRIVLPNTAIPIAVVIEKTTLLATVKELQKSGIYGIIPSAQSFGADETYNGMTALFNRIPYWPDHIINQLPVPSKPTRTPNNQGIQLTDRQHQVLNLVCNRGLSNKKIAAALQISESTVKIHVSSILKTFGVRNRTQLALAAKDRLTAW